MSTYHHRRAHKAATRTISLNLTNFDEVDVVEDADASPLNELHCRVLIGRWTLV
jgi:hypothetical protein